MAEIFAYIAIAIVCVFLCFAVYQEMKFSKVNRIKAEEEISLIRHCIYLMEQNSSFSLDEEENA